ncbi:hypothetical protein D3C80_1603730 [compost metagenome]
MPGQIETQQLTLQLKLLTGRIRPDIRKLYIPILHFIEAKHFDLQLLALLAPFDSRLYRFLKSTQQLRTVTWKRVAGSRLNKRFQHALVDHSQINTAA